MSKTRHTIKAYLYDNLLTPDPNDFTARVSSERSLSVADICHSAATKVDEGDIVVNNPSELMIIIPALPAGTYQLEVTTQYSMGKQWLKEPRTSVFEKTLTVK